MKLVLWVVLAPIILIILLLGSCSVYLTLHDEYAVIEQVVSPDGSRVGVIIGNYGGGGPGYCRDLVYNFPTSEEIPSITSNWAESRNEEYLIKITNCDAIKNLDWENNELVWLGKGTIPNYME